MIGKTPLATTVFLVGGLVLAMPALANDSRSGQGHQWPMAPTTATMPETRMGPATTPLEPLPNDQMAVRPSLEHRQPGASAREELNRLAPTVENDGGIWVRGANGGYVKQYSVPGSGAATWYGDLPENR